MKGTLLLRKDHEKVQELFEKFRRGRGNNHRTVFEEIRREISNHSDVETEIFYPALRETASRRADELVNSATADHGRIDKLLAEITSNNGNDKQFETNVNRLIDAVNEHIAFEEEEIFAEARNNFSEQRLEELGLEMEARKRILGQVAA